VHFRDILKPRLTSIHRSTPHPAANLPFGVKGVGHYRLPPQFNSNVFSTDFVEVFWCVSGKGRILVNGLEHQLRANQAAIYFPNMEHRYFSTDSEWELYWWTMDGELAPVWASAFGFGAGIYKDIGIAPAALFRRLFKELSLPTLSGECRAMTTAIHLLEEMRLNASRLGGRAMDKMETAVDEIHADWKNPKFSVKSLAYGLKMHRSILSRQFKKSFGIPPSEYIIRMRLQHAMTMLHESSKSIAEISESCGWPNQHFFSRLFKKRFGKTPSQLRRKGGRVASQNQRTA